MQTKRTYEFSTFTVLIYTQSEFARELVSDMCRAMRFKAVISKSDFAGAWHAFTNTPIDITFGDVAPDEGCRLLKDIRNDELSPNPRIPFIATALASSPTYILRARDFGATEFLRFPLSANTLIDRVVHVVEHPRDFVKASQYAGPDRRRRSSPIAIEERRKQAPVAAHLDATEPDRNWAI